VQRSCRAADRVTTSARRKRARDDLPIRRAFTSCRDDLAFRRRDELSIAANESAASPAHEKVVLRAAKRSSSAVRFSSRTASTYRAVTCRAIPRGDRSAHAPSATIETTRSALADRKITSLSSRPGAATREAYCPRCRTHGV
jgi:hypothetical protein